MVMGIKRLKSQDALLEAIRSYWNEHIHDLEIASSPVGTPAFFEELDAYRFDKLRYLPKLVNFASFRGHRLLEVGCGIGTDLARFAEIGATVTGIDLAEVAIDLARLNFKQRGLAGDLNVMSGEALQFADDSFDTVYAHGVLQYTLHPERMIAELHRVLRPGGTAILMVYNKYSWLNALSKLTGVPLEHEDAPMFRLYSIQQFRELLRPFASQQIVPERFPVPTRLHQGLKARIYNGLFIGAFERLPKPLVQPFGWHLMTFALK